MSDYTKLPRDIADCMKRAGAELSEDQYMLLAGYLAQTQSDLTAAKAENEALRGRAAELERLEELLPDIKRILKIHRYCGDQYPESGWPEEVALLARLQRLRQKSEAAERGGDDDKP